MRETEKMKWAYETLAVGLIDQYGMPGVEYAFGKDSYCMSRYRDARAAYGRLCERLGVQDEDKDVEIMIQAFLDIQIELCCKMYQYGALFGMGTVSLPD